MQTRLLGLAVVLVTATAFAGAPAAQTEDGTSSTLATAGIATLGDLRTAIAYQSSLVFEEAFLMGPDEIAFLVHGHEVIDLYAELPEDGTGNRDMILETLAAEDSVAVVLPDRGTYGMVYVPLAGNTGEAETCLSGFFLRVGEPNPGPCYHGESPNSAYCHCVGYSSEDCTTACGQCDRVRTPGEVVTTLCDELEGCDLEWFWDDLPSSELQPGMIVFP